MALKNSVVAGALFAFTVALFMLAGESWGESRGSAAATSKPTSTSAPAVAEADFMKVMTARCVRCHQQQCKSVASLKQCGWLKPGQPEKSPVFTVLGKARNGGKYHDVPAAEATAIHDFVAGLK